MGIGGGDGVGEQIRNEDREFAEKQVIQNLASQYKNLGLTLSIKESHWEILSRYAA